jgi:alcohol dehydrogenase (cytochrome c)
MDARTGKSLWHFNTGDFITASPITYMQDGKQYFAIAAGTNIFSFGLPDSVAAKGGKP